MIYCDQTSRYNNKYMLLLLRLVALIDEKINQAIQQVMHHSDFLRLEAKWRGLHYLVFQADESMSSRNQVKLVHASVSEFIKDLSYSLEPDQSYFYNLLYSQEYDMPGGQPYGLLIIDYDIYLRDKPVWVDVISMLSEIVSQSFLPVLFNVQSDIFHLDSFQQISPSIDYKTRYLSCHNWQRVRKKKSALFLNMLCQRVLWRKPYHGQSYQRSYGLSFREVIDSSDQLCWGSSAYLVASMVQSCFEKTGWFNNVCLEKAVLKKDYPSFDRAKITPTSYFECHIDYKSQEKLCALGFMLLEADQYSGVIRFKTAQSLFMKNELLKGQAQDDLFVATLLPYLLCANRFAQYLKVIARNKMGSLMQADQLERVLQQWLHEYCGKADYDDLERISKYPLSSAKVEIQPSPDDPSKFLCHMRLKPNYRLEQVNAVINLVSSVRRKT